MILVNNNSYAVCFQREFVQLVIDGVNKLIEWEKQLEEGKNIDDQLPANCKA